LRALSTIAVIRPAVPTAGQRRTADSSIDPMNPFKFWAQFAEQWQKASADAISFWAEARKSGDAGGQKGR
jgi:hypothetical protein